MRIVSYRGSEAPGGVSSALTQLYQRETQITDWWSISQGHLEQRKRSKARNVFSLDESVVAGHYRHCNNFLWPLLHDMPEFSHYSAADHQCYKEFNESVADYLVASPEGGARVVYQRLPICDFAFAP